MKKLFVFLTAALCFCSANKVMAQVVASGTTGDCTWELTGTPGNYTLTISGNGEMEDYTYSNPALWESYRSDIKTLNIQQGVTTIGDDAFSYCRGLTSVTIPNSVTTIGDYAFDVCIGLTSVTIPNSVTSIGKFAFINCSGLTSVTIGNSVTTIGDWAFANCSGLTSVTIPNSVTTIEESTFNGCSGLTTVTIPNSVTTIGNGAFSGCSSLTSVTIPNSVTSIGNTVFSSCFDLTSITIGNSVTSIGRYAFYGCSLTEIYVKAVNPPEIFEYTFDDVPKSIPVYVCGSVEDYRKANYWSEFTNIIQDNDCNTDIEELSLKNEITLYPNPASDRINMILPENVHQAVFTVYDMQGKVLIQQQIGNQETVSVSNLAAGIYIYNVRTEKKNYQGKISINNE